jgi:hypothetical protein
MRRFIPAQAQKRANHADCRRRGKRRVESCKERRREQIVPGRKESEKRSMWKGPMR